MAGPTHKERLDGHDSRLGQIEVALELKPPEPKKTFLKEKYELLINHKGTSIILGIALCVASVSVTYWLNHRREWWNHDVDERVRLVLNEKDGVNETLHRVDQTVNRTEAKLDTLEPFIRDLIQHQFDSASKLPPSALQGRLPAIQHLTAIAQDHKIRVPAPALDALGRNLSTLDTKTADFWPTAAEFISYRSQAALGDFQSLLRPSLPNCTDHEPTPMEFKANEEIEKHSKINDTFMLPATPEGKDDKGNQLVPARYEDCRFVLDSPEQAQRIPYVAHKHAFRLTFKHCQIVYSGGPISLFSPPPTVNILPSKAGILYGMMGQRVYFEDCLFMFVINSTPPVEGQWLTKQLLAQGGERLTVKAPA